MLEIGYAGAFLGGVATILSPCSAMLLPAFFAYAFGSAQTLIARTAIFWVGLMVTLVPLGVAAGSVGALFNEHRETFILAAGGLVIVFGLIQALGIPLPVIGAQARGGSGPLAVFLLGAVYGVAGTCSGPLLGSVLAVAAMGGDPTRGGLLLGIFSFGMVLPLLVLALLWEALDLGHRNWLRPRTLELGPFTTTVGQLVSGLLFVGIGILLIATDGMAGLGGVLDASTQQQWEVDLMGFSARIGDIVMVMLLFVILGASLAVHQWAQHRRDTRP